MTSSVDLLTFSMRATAPKEGADWFKIVEAKKGEKSTKVYIYDEIGFWGTNAKEFAAILNDIDTDEIELHLNSPGGSVFDGLAIYNTLKDHKSTVIAKVDGVAASAASFILQAADTRQISRNAQVMIHDAKAYAGGNADQMRKAAELLDRVSDNIADIYSVRSSNAKTAEEFRSIMKSGDKWYNGNEALEDGLVDEVTDNPEEDDDDEDAENRVWNVAEVEAFLQAPAEKLVANADRLTIKNRVEEAPMTGANDPQKNTKPPAVPTPPPAPTATQPPAQQAPAQPTQTAPEVKFMVNGAEVTDMTAVQAHITGLESFKKETIETGRKNFVKQLASDGKISASDENLTATEEFAMSLSSDQFDKWKASMSAAPASSLFQKHGVGPGDKSAPANGGVDAGKAEIATLEEIVQAHRDAGMDEETLQKKESYQKLQELKKSNQASS